VTVTVTDALGASANQGYSITINAAPAITTSALPAATVGKAYPSTTVSATGGSAPFTWSATGLPAGLAIDAASAVISGTPTSAGTTSVTVSVTDAAGATASRTYSVTINPAPVINTSTLPDGEQTVAYSATIVGSSGTTPYTWSASALPAGLLINAGSGTITGTPTVTGTFFPTITLKDAAGATTSRTLMLVLYPKLAVTSPSTLSAWTGGRPYPATTINASGGSGAYSWSATGLPSGMSINASSGVVSGTPAVTGSFTVNVTVTDDATPAMSASRSYNLLINAPPSITTTACTARRNTGFSFPLGTTGGTAPFSWSASGLPAWASVSGSGVLTGSAPASGSAAFTITVTDSAFASMSAGFTITVVNGNGSC
jgi:hypothetical protein